MAGEASQEIEVAPGELGGALCGLRLCLPNALEKMELSLSRVGQLTPVQAWRARSGLELFDGLKRLRAAQALSWPKVRVEVHALEPAGAKLRLLLCNAAAGISDLEEAWVIHSLYRDDHLSQPQIAQLLGRHKSWVCRRLTLADGLSDELTAQVRLGLLCARAAVELARLPRGNQDEVGQVVARRGLTTRQTAALVDRLLQAPKEQWGELLKSAALPTTFSEPKGGQRRRTPGEQLVADAWAMKRLSARMQARLLERSLQSLGAESCAVVRGELIELRGVLRALTETLDLRLSAREEAHAAA
jgi:ParB-like chromosome segregation protein Spo0J